MFGTVRTLSHMITATARGFLRRRRQPHGEGLQDHDGAPVAGEPVMRYGLLTGTSAPLVAVEQAGVLDGVDDRRCGTAHEARKWPGRLDNLGLLRRIT